MNAVIRSTGTYVPQRRVSNDELAQYLDTSDEWIASHTGIRFRHIAADDQATSDLAVEASEKALNRAGIDPTEIDLILLATATPDYNGYPSTACIIQDRLGARNASAMDLVAGCTGYIYALETARCFIGMESAANVLVIGAEVTSRMINWQDRNTCVLFGDGAGATIVSAEKLGRRGVLFSYLKSDGSGAESLYRPAGGSRRPYKEGETNPDDLYVQMNGRKVYHFATKALVDTIDSILKLGDIDLDQIKYIVPHQANLRIIEAAAKRENLPLDRFYINIQEFANTSAATIPIALAEMQGKHMLQEGDLIMTIGFGAGLTYGGNLIRW